MNSTAEGVGWVAEPTGRGTIGLLWSCFATIFLCTWSAVHPNLPGIDEPARKILSRKIGYLICAIVAPEVWAIDAMVRLRGIKRLRKTLALKHPITQRAWSLKQYYFLDMGGFVVEIQSSLKRIPPKALVDLIIQDKVDAPTIEDRDIDDRSKASWFTKAIALIQVGWFLAQLLARAITQLPITTLELFTLSIVACGLITYICCWQQPFDVQRPVIVRPKVRIHDWPDDVKRIISFEGMHYEGKTFYFLATFVCWLFGATHLIGWNFHFASSTEKWMWRVGSLVLPSWPILLLLTMDDPVEKWFGDSEWSHSAIVSSILASYLGARICLFVEVFVGLRSVPAGVYQTVQWAEYFPSFG